MIAAVLLLAAALAVPAGSRVGKVASTPYPKVEVSSKVETRATTTVAPEPVELEPAPTTAAPRDLLADCRAVVTELLPQYPPAPGWADPVCHAPDLDIEAQFGRPLQGYALWRQKTIHLTPTNPQLDLRYLYKHEVGHSFCANDGDYTEECADAWAVAA